MGTSNTTVMKDTRRLRVFGQSSQKRSVATTPLCPVTGWPIRTDPLWTVDVGGESPYHAEFVIIGTNIISATIRGFTTLAISKLYLAKLDEISSAFLPKSSGFVFLEDYAHHLGTSREARNNYLAHQKNNKRLLGIVFYNVSILFAAMIRVGKIFVRVPFAIDIVAEYDSALRLAQHYLNDVFDETQPLHIGNKKKALKTSMLDGSTKIEPQVRDLIDFMASINWQQTGFPTFEKQFAASGILRPLYDALLVVKNDYDENVRERNAAMQKQQELQKELHHAERMQTLGTLAGGVAHDFNNMLSGITGFASLLKMKHAHKDTEIRHYSDQMLDICGKASTVVSQLLAFARKGRNETVPIDVSNFMRSTHSMLCHTIDKRVTISLNSITDEMICLGDRSLLQNALLNLALNAADAMPNGGSIVLSTRLEIVSDSNLSGFLLPIKTGTYVVISVKDSGTGIPKEHQQRIFEPFFTTKDPGKGTGLGLSSVYGTIQNHEGSLKLESEQGKGTAFHLYLKASDSKVLTEAATSVAQAKESYKILVIDDEPTIQETVAEMLRHLGHSPIVANDPAHALKMVNATPLEFDLVLLDMIMPTMSGSECFCQLLAINPHLKVVLLTGFSGHASLEDLTKRGARGHLLKPFSFKALAEIVSRIGAEK